MTRPPLKLLSIFVALSLSGCAQNPQPLGKPMPQLHYNHLPAFEVSNGTVQIKQSAIIDAASFRTMNAMVTPFDKLLNYYARSRFFTAKKAPSLPVNAIFDIQKLSLHQKSEEDNILGILSGAAAEFYTLEVLMTLSTVSKKGQLNKPYSIKVKRELLIPERSSLAESEMLQFEFMEAVIQDIDSTIIKFMSNINGTLPFPKSGNE